MVDEIKMTLSIWCSLSTTHPNPFPFLPIDFPLATYRPFPWPAIIPTPLLTPIWTHPSPLDLHNATPPTFSPPTLPSHDQINPMSPPHFRQWGQFLCVHRPVSSSRVIFWPPCGLPCATCGTHFGAQHVDRLAWNCYNHHLMNNSLEILSFI